MKVKVNDQVKVLAGKDKGKTGTVIRTLKAKNKVVVSGINMIKKHSKPNNTNEKGGIFDIEAPIHASNVKVVESSKETKKVAKKETQTKDTKKVTKKTTKKESKEA